MDDKTPYTPDELQDAIERSELRFERLVATAGALAAAEKERDKWKRAAEANMATAERTCTVLDETANERDEARAELMRELANGPTATEWAMAVREREGALMALRDLVEYERKRHPPRMGGDHYPPSLKPLMAAARTLLGEKP